MEFLCSNCPHTLLGPPDLNGTACPECHVGELGSTGRISSNLSVEDLLDLAGWAEAPAAFEATYESVQDWEARRENQRTNEAHMLQAVRQDAAPSFITGGRP